jgi:predicted transcriptional regulator
MARLLERGSDSRTAIIASLSENPSQTEDELIEATGLGRSTVRNTLQSLLKAELASSKRRKRNDGRRGPGPIEYWLTTGKAKPQEVEAQLREAAPELEENGGAEVHHIGGKTLTIHATGPPLYVIVKTGTNDAVLTKDGRMLRVEQPALPKVLDQYRKVLRGNDLESMSLEDYYRRFYPELKGKDREDQVF